MMMMMMMMKMMMKMVVMRVDDDDMMMMMMMMMKMIDGRHANDLDADLFGFSKLIITKFSSATTEEPT